MLDNGGYILGVLLINTQDSDILAVSDILKAEGFSSPFSLFKELKELGFSRLDVAYTLDCLALAYGMDWLREYFEKHQEELRRYY